MPAPGIDKGVDVLVAGNEGDSIIDEDANNVVGDVTGATSVAVG